MGSSCDVIYLGKRKIPLFYVAEIPLNLDSLKAVIRADC